MTDEEFKYILDRDKNKKDFDENFKDLQNLLINITNYGSKLIPRCFKYSNRKIEDIILLGVLLRQIVAMLDSCELLISNASLYTSHLPMRALFEASVYIDFILRDETHKKSKYYYVSDLRHKLVWALRAAGKSADQVEIEKTMNEINENFTFSNHKFKEEGERQINEIRRILSLDIYKSINNEFDLYKKKISYEPAWYRPLKFSSFRKIAIEVGRLAQYELFYSKTSDIIHTSNYSDHIKITDEKVIFERIRQLEGIKTLSTIVITIGLNVYRKIIGHYRPQELENFSKKYIEEWRDIFRNIKDVNYNIEYDNVI